MLIRLLIFSALVLFVHCVAGIFARDYAPIQSIQDGGASRRAEALLIRRRTIEASRRNSRRHSDGESMSLAESRDGLRTNSTSGGTTESNFVEMVTSRKRRVPSINTNNHNNNHNNNSTASTLTMSETLYNYFRPLDKDLPEDDLLPFLAFGKKLSRSEPSTSSTNYLDVTTIRGGRPELKSLTAEEEFLGEMDVAVSRPTIEGNKPQKVRVSLHGKTVSSTTSLNTEEPDIITTTSNSVATKSRGRLSYAEINRRNHTRVLTSLNASTSTTTTTPERDSISLEQHHLPTLIESPETTETPTTTTTSGTIPTTKEPLNITLESYLETISTGESNIKTTTIKNLLTTRNSYLKDRANNSRLNRYRDRQDIHNKSSDFTEKTNISSSTFYINIPDEVTNVTKNDAEIVKSKRIEPIIRPSVIRYNIVPFINNNNKSEILPKNFTKEARLEKAYSHSLRQLNKSVSQQENTTELSNFTFFKGEESKPVILKRPDPLIRPNIIRHKSNPVQTRRVLEQRILPRTRAELFRPLFATEKIHERLTKASNRTNRTVVYSDEEKIKNKTLAGVPQNEEANATKILSTAIVTSVSVRGSWTTDSPSQESTLANPTEVEEHSSSTESSFVQVSSSRFTPVPVLSSQEFYIPLVTLYDNNNFTLELKQNLTSKNERIPTEINKNIGDEILTIFVQTTLQTPLDVKSNNNMEYFADSNVTESEIIIPEIEVETKPTKGEESIKPNPLSIHLPDDQLENTETETPVLVINETTTSRPSTTTESHKEITDHEKIPESKDEKKNVSVLTSTTTSSSPSAPTTRRPNRIRFPVTTPYWTTRAQDHNPVGVAVVTAAQPWALSTYLLAALGIIPLIAGFALLLRHFIRKRKKLLDDSDAYSEVSSRPAEPSATLPSALVSGGQMLPRVQSQLNWDQEKLPATLQAVRATKWEFPRSKLRLQTVLGQGNFGQVVKAEADDLAGHEGMTRLVAVKSVKEHANARERDDLLRELAILQQLGAHPNVVTLLGCCTEQEPYLLIMEYVMYGKLLAFLRDHRKRRSYFDFSEESDALTLRDLMVFAYCIARGMDYLTTKGIVHRDLAARNVLVDHNRLCKIADFGMSRNVKDTGDVYEQTHTKGALPIRWMAPESLFYRIFTHKSDVWSFGIVLWEIATLGCTPYPNMGAREVMRRVREGYRLERPEHCPVDFYQLMLRCSQLEPNKRPTFSELKHSLAGMVEATEAVNSEVCLPDT